MTNDSREAPGLIEQMVASGLRSSSTERLSPDVGVCLARAGSGLGMGWFRVAAG